MKHLLVDRRPRPRRASSELLDLSEHVRRGQPSATSRRSRRCGARWWCRSSTRTPPAPGSRSRPRPSGSRADIDDLLASRVVGEEGREPARHRADHRGDGHRRDRRAPPGRRRAAPRRRRGSTPAVINAGDGRHEHPTQALLDALTLRRHRGAVARRLPHRDRRRHRATRASPAATCKALARARRRGHARRAAHAAARVARRLAGHGRATTSTTSSPRSTSSTCCASSTSAAGRRCSRRSASTPRATGSPPSAPARLKPDTLVMHPGPMNRGVEIAAEVADGPALARHRAGRERRRGAHGRALVAPRIGRSALSERADHAAGACVDETGERVADVRGASTDAIAEVGAGPARRPARRARRRRAASSRPGSSTSTCTSASRAARRPRRSRPAPAPPRSAASPRWSRCRTPTRRSTTPRSSRRCSSAGERAAVRRACRRAASPRAAPGEELAPMGELYDLGVRIFTDDGDCVADAGVMRRALEYAPALPGAVLAQHAEDADARRAAGTCTKARGRAASASPAGPRRRRRRSSPATSSCARLTGGRCHVLHLSTAGAVELVRAAKARRRARHRRGAPHHFALTDECCASFDPVFKVNPPLRTDADVDAHPRGPGRRHHRRHRHRPRAAPAGDEGAPVRGGAAGDARPRDRARASRSPSSSSRACYARARRSALLSWRPAAHRRRSTRRHGGPIAPGAPANLCVIDPRPTLGRRRRTRLASRSRNTPFAGRKLTGKVRHTILRGDAVVHRRRGHAMSDACTDGAAGPAPTATTFEGEAIGVAGPSDGGRGRRGRVQHRARPATRRSSPTRRTRARSSRSPIRTSATTASTPTTTRAARPFCRGRRSCATSRAAPSNWRATERPRRLPRAPRRARHRRDRHPPPHPPPPRRRARCPARSAPTRPRVRAAAAQADGGTDGIDLVADGHHRPSPTSSGDDDAPFRVVAYDFGIKRIDPRHLVAAGCQVEVVPASTTGRRRARPRARRRVPLERPRRSRRGRRRRRRRARAARRGAGVRHLPRPPDPRPRARRATPSSCAFGHHGGNHPVRHERDRPGRDHQPEPQLRGRRRLARPTASTITHVNLNDGDVEGVRVDRRAARSACSTTPRPGPGPHDARYLFDEFTDSDAGELTLMPKPHRPRDDPASSAAARSSSARRASSTTRARRRAGCCAKRATASCS